MEFQNITFNFLSQISTVTYITIALVAIFCVMYLLQDWIRIYRFIFTLDGPPVKSIFGNADAILKGNMLQRMSDEKLLYGRLFRVWLICLPYAVLLYPEDIQIVLQSKKHVAKIGLYKLINNILGKGLITHKVDKWKAHRPILQPIFHYQALKQFIATLNECADCLVTQFLERSGEDINITSYINNTVYNMLIEAVLGLPVNGGCNYETPFKKSQLLIRERFARPWLLIDWIYQLTENGKSEERYQKDLFDFCFMRVKQKRESICSHNISNSDEQIKMKSSFLEYMIELKEKNPSFNDSDIIEECCTFMLAGQDSVSTATAVTLFLLANNPAWQEKCISELDEIFGDDGRPATIEEFQAMKCLEMCIKESMRLYPSVPIIARLLDEDVKIGDKVIPAGCGVFFSPYTTHRLPQYYPDPDKFDPERFNAENSRKRHPFAYIPFSAGPRNCIGYKFAMLEIKSIISAILRKCRLEPVPGKEKLNIQFRITIRAVGGLWVKVKSRHIHK